MSHILSIIIGLLLSSKISKSPESRRVGYLNGADVRVIAYPSGRLFFHHASWPSNYEVRQDDVEKFFTSMSIIPVKPVKETVLWTPEASAIEPTRIEKPNSKKLKKSQK